MWMCEHTLPLERSATDEERRNDWVGSRREIAVSSATGVHIEPRHFKKTFNRH